MATKEKEKKTDSTNSLKSSKIKKSSKKNSNVLMLIVIILLVFFVPLVVYQSFFEKSDVSKNDLDNISNNVSLQIDSMRMELTGKIDDFGLSLSDSIAFLKNYAESTALQNQEYFKKSINSMEARFNKRIAEIEKNQASVNGIITEKVKTLEDYKDENQKKEQQAKVIPAASPATSKPSSDSIVNEKPKSTSNKGKIKEEEKSAPEKKGEKKEPKKRKWGIF